MRECNDRGYQCCVLSDCTQGFDANQVSTSLDIICGQDGLFGFVGHSSDVLAAIPEAKGPEPSTSLSATGRLPSIENLRSMYQAGTISPVDVINSVFDRIEARQKVDTSVWTSLVSREDALSAANDLTADYKDKPLPALFGIPFSVKDNIDVAGVNTTNACDSYATAPSQHAVAVQHILDAGGIYIGKTNLDQLATGLSGCRSPYGIPHNSFSSKYIPGGSSSGGAVAVGSDLVSFSLTTDTAGSTRIPAALNSVTGLKPTKGTVSARGLAPACKSLDTISIIAPSVADTRTIWRVIGKHDRADSFSKMPQSLATWHVDFRGLKKGGFTFAVPPQEALDACTPAYKELFARAVESLCASGGQIREIDYSVFEKAGNLLYEGAMLHERIACIGESFLRSNTAPTNGTNGTKDSKTSLHPAIHELFTKALANPPSAYDVFRDQALQTELTRLAQQAFDTLEGGVDVLVVPATVCHPTVEEMLADPLGLNFKMGKFSHYGNVVDLCGVSVPAGTYEDGEGTVLPFGVTIVGGSGYDGKILDVAALLEEAVAERV